MRDVVFILFNIGLIFKFNMGWRLFILNILIFIKEMIKKIKIVIGNIILNICVIELILFIIK